MHRVRVHHLDIQDLGRLSPRVFDVACSNFGPLNCVADLTEAARRIAERLVPGGLLIASVIGRVCPWELAVHLARGKWARARLRFARGVVAVPLCGRVVWMRYYAPSELEKAFAAAGFRREWLRALGLFVPPPYMDAFAARHPGFVSALQAVEDAAGEWPLVRQFGDHFLIALRKS